MKKKILLTALILGVLSYVFSQTNTSAQTNNSFSFGAAGDFANGSNFRATVDAVARENPNFFLVLGDNSYTVGAESSWCSTWKAKYQNVFLITGNHDNGEGTGGNINTYIQHCPFTFSGLNGSYGHQYYFDYPSGSPTARFIMIRPGIRDPGSISYNAGGAGYNFARDAIDDARARGISWVIVGFHKNYISAMEKPNEVGTDLMKLLLDKKVDLVLQGHEHGYERSKQLTTSANCNSVPLNTFNANCVVDSDNSLVKGAGTVIHVIGTGGQGLRGLNTGDSEYPYFATANNTTNGFGKFSVTPNQLSFNFVRSAGGNFADSFTITGSGVNPTPTPTAPAGTNTPTPTNPPSTPVVTAPPTTPTPCPNVSMSGTVLYSANLEQNTYKLWARMQSQGSGSNSFYVQVDNNCPVVMGDSDSISTNTWQWIDYKNGNSGDKTFFSLPAGAHTIKIGVKENGARLDKIILTSDQNCVPVDHGNNCTSVVIIETPTPSAAVTPTPAPTPTAGPISGSVINASEDAHVNKRRPSTNYGTSNSLHVDGSPDEITYLKFDLTGLANTEINTAVLKLSVSNYSRQPQTVYSVSNSWSEGDIKYENKPAFGQKISDMTGADVGDVIAVDITEFVRANKGRVVSMAIDTNKADALYIYSKEEAGKGPVVLINANADANVSSFSSSSRIKRQSGSDDSEDGDDD